MSAGRVPTSPKAGLPTGTGLVKVTANVGGLASAGVDYSKGPWKLFSTVRLSVAGQTLSIPVVDGDGNGIIRATGRIISDGTARDLRVKINGSTSNVVQQYLTAQNTATGAARTAFVGSTGVGFCMFQLVMMTAKTANALKRAGFIIVTANAAAAADQLTIAGFDFSDTTTTITSIDLDCGNATGMAANSEVLVEEGIVS